MIVGYARVSTSAQDLANQLDQLKAAGCERIFQDKLSGLTKERPQLKKLLGSVGLGDTVIIPAIGRLSRDTADLLTIARDLKAPGRWAALTGGAGDRHHQRVLRYRPGGVGAGREAGTQAHPRAYRHWPGRC